MTLTEISYYFRRFLPFAVLAFLVFLILIYSVRLLFILIKTQNRGPIATNPVFGKISKPIIPNATPSANIQFKIDTVEGEPITATEAAKVIFLTPPAAGFGYLEKIYLMAKTMGFDTDVTKHRTVRRGEILFEDETQRLNIDISTFNFTYLYFFENNTSLFEGVDRINEAESNSEAINFLRSIGRYPDELTQGKTNTSFLKFDTINKSIVTLPTENHITANMAEVDFFRPDIDQYPTVYSNYFTSDNYVLLTSTPSGAKILRAQIRFFDKSENQVGFYPLKSGQQAFEDLKKGRGLVVSNPNNLKEVTIKKMFLAYYDPVVYQDYLQPVYVFLGGADTDRFVVYVPAVTDEYLME